jgi:hypothetical protein
LFILYNAIHKLTPFLAIGSVQPSSVTSCSPASSGIQVGDNIADIVHCLQLKSKKYSHYWNIAHHLVDCFAKRNYNGYELNPFHRFTFARNVSVILAGMSTVSMKQRFAMIMIEECSATKQFQNNSTDVKSIQEYVDFTPWKRDSMASLTAFLPGYSLPFINGKICGRIYYTNHISVARYARFPECLRRDLFSDSVSNGFHGPRNRYFLKPKDGDMLSITNLRYIKICFILSSHMLIDNTLI